VRQVTTAGACHLDATHVEQHLQEWDLAKLDCCSSKNVGTWSARPATTWAKQPRSWWLSVTEGEDKRSSTRASSGSPN